MEENKKDLTFQPYQAGFCQKCGKQQEKLYLATISAGEKKQSRVLCRDCAKQLKARFDTQNASRPREPGQQMQLQNEPAYIPPAPPSARMDPYGSASSPKKAQFGSPAMIKRAAAICLAVILVIVGVFLIHSCVARNSGSSSIGSARVAKNFAIEGKWKNVGDTSCAQMQEGAITTFDGEHCNVYSPRDTYAFYSSNGSYYLDCTSFFAGDSMNFTVNIIDNDNIELIYDSDTIVKLTRIG